MQANILVIDDDPNLCELVAHELQLRGHEVRHVQSAEEGLKLLTTSKVDAVITDVNMSGMTGVELCKHVRILHADLPVIVMTADGSLSSAIASIRAGAYDYVTKPFNFDHFALAIDRAVGLYRLRCEVARLRANATAASEATPLLLGRSRSIERVRELVSRVADSEATILVTGETGTGKEVVAKALHEQSARKNGPFVAINCAAVPENLLESELFGHAKGAFTDAKASRTGLFVRANEGTIFLDEIGEMPLPMQAKLLRAIQERRVRPVGSDQEVEFNARIVAATHRDLENDVKEKRFREDLFYRINVVRIHVPPLRARDNDVLLLAQRFLVKKGMSAPVAQRMLEFPWPGNVRQLQNCVERAMAVARGPEITLEDLPDDVREYQASKLDLVHVDAQQDLAHMPKMEEIERRYIRQVLIANGGNKTVAAQVLGYDRRTLYRKLESMQSEPRDATATPTATGPDTQSPSDAPPP